MYYTFPLYLIQKTISLKHKSVFERQYWIFFSRALLISTKTWDTWATSKRGWRKTANGRPDCWERERVLSCFDINWYYVVVPHILKVTSKTGLDTGRREAGWRHLGNTSFWPLPCFPASLVPAFLLTSLRVSAALAASCFSVPTVPVPLVVVFIKLKSKVVLLIWQELEGQRHTFQKEKFGIWDNLGNIWIAPAVTTVPVASIIPWRQVMKYHSSVQFWPDTYNLLSCCTAASCSCHHTHSSLHCNQCCCTHSRSSNHSGKDNHHGSHSSLWRSHLHSLSSLRVSCEVSGDSCLCTLSPLQRGAARFATWKLDTNVISLWKRVNLFLALKACVC